jgi:hypothetical protein
MKNPFENGFWGSSGPETNLNGEFLSLLFETVP